ncbi:MAG: NarK/NasA family nitrate transporter [Deltaproteobacteria bacterium]|nr:NarK/NasA family nitrate transporter [Deltaproteobacteria bacterium]
MSNSFLEQWRPEEESFWNGLGSRIGWRTLAVTTFCLTLSFATWFLMSVLVVRLPQIGFTYSAMELFWLAAMPGLAGGTFRIIHTFLIPIFGTRAVVTWTTLIKLLPCVGIGWAIMNPETPFWVFLALAFLVGMGGGDFSSYMPSTSLFFPKRLQGRALGIQAGIGNFGVSLTQFVTPLIIGVPIFGALAGTPQTLVVGGVSKQVWCQNAALWYIPLLIAGGIAAWALLRSVPVRASFREQLDIFKDRHTWYCTLTYVMTFGTFSGFAATFPLLIKTCYGVFPGAPDPLTYAFLGPLIGSAMRIVGGFVADRTGGGILTQLAGIGIIVCAGSLVGGGYLTPSSVAQFPVFVALMLGIFFFSGLGNASTFRQYPIIFRHSPRQGAQVLGWTGAVAAYGPFVYSALLGASITSLGSATSFFVGVMVFSGFAVGINWWFYVRKGCARPS